MQYLANGLLLPFRGADTICIPLPKKLWRKPGVQSRREGSRRLDASTRSKRRQSTRCHQMLACEWSLACGRTRLAFLIGFIFLLLHSQFFLLDNLGLEERIFFFEKATSQSVVEGYPNAVVLQPDVASLQRILVSDYVKWHNTQISAIKHGNRSMNKVQTMIFFGKGRRHGLGDRFRGILFAYLCSVFTQRVLLIQWDEPYPLSRIFVNGIGTNFTYDSHHFGPSRLPNGSLNEIHVEDVKSMHELPKVMSTAQTIWLDCEPVVSWNEVFEIVEEFPTLPTSRKLSEILPFQVRPEATAVFPLLFQALFRPSAELKKLISTPILYQNRFSLSRLRTTGPLRKIRLTQPYVSVHARLGHGVGERTKRFDLEGAGLSIESIADCMADRAFALARMVELADPPRFYLATDTVEFRALFEEAVSKRDKRAAVMYGLWGVRHVKNLHKDRAGDFSKYLYTMLDVFLLSKGKGALCGESGFCSLATWMGGIRTASYFRRESCAGVNGTKLSSYRII